LLDLCLIFAFTLFVVVTIAGSVFAGITTIVIISVLLHCYGLVPWKRGSDIESFMKTQGSSQPRWPVKYTFAQLKHITRSFSVKLGTGGYGAVYRGQLPGGSNVLVAVKLLTNKKGRGEDFENEVTTISRASHFNIISLLGYCLEGSHRALVYEYMQNGSLNLYTFGSIDSVETKQLHWQKLYEIVVGVARGIDYLYTGCRTQILHFDIKPENILLDQNMCLKISDFGLAKLCKKKGNRGHYFWCTRHYWVYGTRSVFKTIWKTKQQI
jgi:chitinase